ncbi:hypothetical protein QQS21_006069 [Conoideocrella luteorostrata]|uniref:Uncharacterized protein n=1 Tax=Conoideocrella luteorostrata TaxID=1105319 RepID=A0AAJ0CND3_9HYPO|nr:hypothetical protein QQS21_006069 [Conoideocrella luteorostrata]
MRYSYMILGLSVTLALASVIKEQRATGKLLPFIGKRGIEIEREVTGNPELACGTDLFCRFFDVRTRDRRHNIQGNFRGRKDCLAARESRVAIKPRAEATSPKKLRYIEESETDKSSGCFRKMGGLETCLGSRKYCETEAYKSRDSPKAYASKRECFEDRDIPVSSKIPFVGVYDIRSAAAPAKLPFIEESETDKSLNCVQKIGELEICLGSRRYCETEAYKSRDSLKQYASKEECFADRKHGQSPVMTIPLGRSVSISEDARRLGKLQVVQDPRILS